MPNRLQIAGDKYGKLTVIDFSYIKSGQSYWVCECDCGKLKIIRANSMRTGKVISCGCELKRKVAERARKQFSRHNMTKTRFYSIWAGMFKRCYKPAENNYKYYGAKGITVSKAWHLFDNFMVDMHQAYLDHSQQFGEIDTTLDRIDSNGNYNRENCRWATRLMQSQNRNLRYAKKIIA